MVSETQKKRIRQLSLRIFMQITSLLLVVIVSVGLVVGIFGGEEEWREIANHVTDVAADSMVPGNGRQTLLEERIDVLHRVVPAVLAVYTVDGKKLAGAGTVASKTDALQIKAGAEEGSIDIAYFKELVAKDPQKVMLIDVRDADEFNKGSIKTAVNIPVDDLETKVKSLPTDKPIVFICGTGARSGESFYMVQDIRPEMKNVYYLDAEMTINKDGSFTVKKPVT